MIICQKCIYDENVPLITFNKKGICNYCRQHEQLDNEYPIGRRGNEILSRIIEKVKLEGKGKKYDVIVGISGGCDSTYLLYKSIQWGLRPLAVHFDNTWNSTIAVKNINSVLKKLNVDLYTHVVNNREFTDIFRSFVLASVPDIDTPSDIGLASTHYLAAEKYGIKYIFEGHSFRTEGISPPGWFYIDGKYVESVHKQFGTIRMKTFPNLTLTRFLKRTLIDRIRKIRPLYYLNYNKEETKKLLKAELGWQWYGGHHMENRTAYFANNFWLPKKTNIDLRYSEYSALIRSKQMSRKTALALIKQPKIIDKSIIEEIKKRLSFTEREFQRIMNGRLKTYRDYKTYKAVFEILKPLFWSLYKTNHITKSFYIKYACKNT
jgi:N-acetyl sugar amidotransferase